MPKRKTLVLGGIGTLIIAGILVVVVLAALGIFNKKGGSSSGGSSTPTNPVIPTSDYYFRIKNIQLIPSQCTHGSGKPNYAGIQFDTEHNIPVNEIDQALVNASFTGSPGYDVSVDVSGPPSTHGLKFNTNFPPPTGLFSFSINVIVNQTELENSPIPWAMPHVSTC